jgi:hypothetical protein
VVKMERYSPKVRCGNHDTRVTDSYKMSRFIWCMLH